MKPDQEKVRVLLVDTVALLCKNGLSFKSELKIQGLLGITVDGDDVFIVHIDETFSEAVTPSRRNGSGARDVKSKTVPEPVAEYNQSFRLSKGNVVAPHSGSKPGRKRLRMEVQPVKHEIENWREDDSSTWAAMHDSSLKAKIEDQNVNNNLFESDAKDCDAIWIEPDMLNETTDEINFESQSVHSFDADNDLVAFNQPVNSSYDSNICDVPCDLNSSDMIIQAEGGLEIKSEETRKGRTNRHPAGRRKSRRKNTGVPLTSAVYASLVSNSDGQWSAEADAINSIPEAVCWENEDENMQQEDYQEWSNWENGRGRNKRSSQIDDDREKSFACQYDDCDKAFYRKDHLIRHQRIKHGKPFGVDSQTVFYCHFGDCGKTFYKNSSLHRHMNDAHGIAPQE